MHALSGRADPRFAGAAGHVESLVRALAAGIPAIGVARFVGTRLTVLERHYTTCS